MRFAVAILLLLGVSNAYAQGRLHGSPQYCAAIRGNGENVAAHWVAMARLVEELGMPQVMAGGSSATITMFLTESIAQNSLIAEQKDSVVRRRMQGLLLKSLPIYIALMAEQEGALDAFRFMRELGQKESPLAKALDLLLIGGGNATELLAKLKAYGPLFNPDLLNGLVAAPVFFQKETRSAISVFGKFDAVGDENLFVRPGVLDFKYFALILGRIADSYAGQSSALVKAKLDDFLLTCSEQAYGKAWNDISSDCQNKFKDFVVNDVSTIQHGRSSTRLFQNVGATLQVYPTTSLVSGAAKDRYLSMSEKYARGENLAYADFAVDFDSDLSYGYWGDIKKLERMQKRLVELFPDDLKSSKFKAIGPGNWFEVLSTSPAEPGLANIQKIPYSTSSAQVASEASKIFSKRWQGLSYRADVVSAGGWSDLHPTLVLRAAGCDNVVYINRKDGDTVFGQQVFIRLTGTQEELPFWENIGDRNKEGWPVTAIQAELPWNKISNMGNPKSSIRKSIDEADAVYCTDWNAYDIFKGEMFPMIAESYVAPVFVKDSLKSWLGVNPGPIGPTGYVPGCSN